MMGFGDVGASDGPYANNLHLVPDRLPHQHVITQFLHRPYRMLFLASVQTKCAKALKANQSTELKTQKP